MLTKQVLTGDDALLILQAAQEEARAHQWAVSIAVCDDGGHLLGFVRMPGANPASAGIAQSKALTAAMLRRETQAVEDMINGGRTAFVTAPGLSGMLEGGVPVMVGGQCVGAVGVSGVKAPEDAQIAKRGAQVMTG